MTKRMAAAALLCLLPGLVWAQPPRKGAPTKKGTVAKAAPAGQEKVLPARTQLYYRWDGIDAHRPAFEKTAAGQMMKGETGVFVRALWKYAQDLSQLAAQNEPEAGAHLESAFKVLGGVYRDGFVMGIEVQQVNPPQVDAVFVFPKGGGEEGALLPTIQKLAEKGNNEVKTEKVGKRFVHQVQEDMVQFGWWGEGDDAVLYLGTQEPAAYAGALDDQKGGLAKHPLYQKVRGFKDFTTCSRGYFDAAAVFKVAGGVAPQAEQVIEELGLKGLKSITFVSGFEGPAQRSVVEMETTGERKGLLSFSSQKKVVLKDLPTLPADLTGFSVSSVEPAKGYDVIQQMAEGVVKVFAPDQVENVKETIKAFEGVLGVDLRDDLFGSLGNTLVVYSSPAEGPLGLGSVMLIEAKDPKKLTKTIETLVKAVPAMPGGGGELELKRKKYRGGDILELHLKGETSAHLGTLGVYKNWLIYAQYPQPIKGFILRQNGDLPAWKASAELEKVLGQMPEDYTSLAVGDPRPALELLLSLTPTAMNAINAVTRQAMPGAPTFDLDLIPHPQEATRHLFPNVTVTTDDGKVIRAETRGALVFP